MSNVNPNINITNPSVTTGAVGVEEAKEVSAEIPKFRETFSKPFNSLRALAATKDGSGSKEEKDPYVYLGYGEVQVCYDKISTTALTSFIIGNESLSKCYKFRCFDAVNTTHPISKLSEVTGLHELLNSVYVYARGHKFDHHKPLVVLDVMSTPRRAMKYALKAWPNERFNFVIKTQGIPITTADKGRFAGLECDYPISFAELLRRVESKCVDRIVYDVVMFNQSLYYVTPNQVGVLIANARERIAFSAHHLYYHQPPTSLEPVKWFPSPLYGFEHEVHYVAPEVVEVRINGDKTYANNNTLAWTQRSEPCLGSHIQSCVLWDSDVLRVEVIQLTFGELIPVARAPVLAQMLPITFYKDNYSARASAFFKLSSIPLVGKDLVHRFLTVERTCHVYVEPCLVEEAKRALMGCWTKVHALRNVVARIKSVAHSNGIEMTYYKYVACVQAAYAGQHLECLWLPFMVSQSEYSAIESVVSDAVDYTWVKWLIPVCVFLLGVWIFVALVIAGCIYFYGWDTVVNAATVAYEIFSPPFVRLLSWFRRTYVGEEPWDRILSHKITSWVDYITGVPGEAVAHPVTLPAVPCPPKALKPTPFDSARNDYTNFDSKIKITPKDDGVVDKSIDQIDAVPKGTLVGPFCPAVVPGILAPTVESRLQAYANKVLSPNYESYNKSTIAAVSHLFAHFVPVVAAKTKLDRWSSDHASIAFYHWTGGSVQSTHNSLTDADEIKISNAEIISHNNKICDHDILKETMRKLNSWIRDVQTEMKETEKPAFDKNGKAVPFQTPKYLQRRSRLSVARLKQSCLTTDMTAPSVITAKIQMKLDEKRPVIVDGKVAEVNARTILPVGLDVDPQCAGGVEDVTYAIKVVQLKYFMVQRILDLPFIFCPGMDGVQMGQVLGWVIEAVGLKDGNYVILVFGDDLLICFNDHGTIKWLHSDKTNYDSTITSAWLKVETAVFKFLVEDPVAVQAFEAYLKPFILVAPELKAKNVGPSRVTGSNQTTLGNSLYNGLSSLMVITLLRITNRPMTSSHFSDACLQVFGLLDKAVVCDHLSKVDFLSARFIPIFRNGIPTYALVPHYKCLYKIGYVMHVTDKPAELQGIVSGLIDGLTYVGRGDLIISELARVWRLKVPKMDLPLDLTNVHLPWFVRMSVSSHVDNFGDSYVLDADVESYSDWHKARYGVGPSLSIEAISEYGNGPLVSELKFPQCCYVRDDVLPAGAGFDTLGVGPVEQVGSKDDKAKQPVLYEPDVLKH